MLSHHEIESYESLGDVEYGAPMRKKFPLADNLVATNHGSYGSPANSVLQRQQAAQLEMERNPDVHFRFFSEPKQRSLMENGLADFIGARPEDCMFVVNATTAQNAVVDSCVTDGTVSPGKIVMGTSLNYNASTNALDDRSERAQAVFLKAMIRLPVTSEEAVIRDVMEAVRSKDVANNLKLLFIDHICASTAFVFPVKKLVAAVREVVPDVVIVVDGAHCLGQIEVNVEDLDVDYYFGNCHKWLFSTKGAAILWARPGVAQTRLMPLNTGHEWKSKKRNPPANDMLKTFWKQGTREESAFVSAGEGLKFFKAIGGWQKLHPYRKQLLKWAVEHLLDEFSKLPGYAEKVSGYAPTPMQLCPLEMNACMAVVRLPFTDDAKLAPEFPRATTRSNSLLTHLLVEHNTSLAIWSFKGHLWGRLSVQVYNEKNDYEECARQVVSVWKAIGSTGDVSHCTSCPARVGRSVLHVSKL